MFYTTGEFFDKCWEVRAVEVVIVFVRGEAREELYRKMSDKCSFF